MTLTTVMVRHTVFAVHFRGYCCRYINRLSIIIILWGLHLVGGNLFPIKEIVEVKWSFGKSKIVIVDHIVATNRAVMLGTDCSNGCSCDRVSGTECIVEQ